MRAPMRPAEMSCWMRVSRMLTREYSPAAKKALAATRSRIGKTPEQHKSNHGALILTFERELLAQQGFVGESVRAQPVWGQPPSAILEPKARFFAPIF